MADNEQRMIKAEYDSFMRYEIITMYNDKASKLIEYIASKGKQYSTQEYDTFTVIKRRK